MYVTGWNSRVCFTRLTRVIKMTSHVILARSQHVTYTCALRTINYIKIFVWNKTQNTGLSNCG
jgi:hypothetical protein